MKAGGGLDAPRTLVDAQATPGQHERRLGKPEDAGVVPRPPFHSESALKAAAENQPMRRLEVSVDGARLGDKLIESLAAYREQNRPREWSRRVTLGDLQLFHKKKSSRCCRGEIETFTHVGGQRRMRVCEVALKEFRKRCAGRCDDASDGPRWLRGLEPENFVLWEIFQNSMQVFEAERQLRARLDARCTRGGNGRWWL